jgi:formamidopyrimidine-DNA glycosylase
MPELPDVEYMRKKLLPARGKRITDVRVYEHGFVTFASVSDLFGAQIERISRRGKFILIEVDTDQIIIAHMGMTGELRLSQKGEAPEIYTKCSIHLDDDRRLFYTCTRKLGMLGSVKKGHLDDVQLLANLGPEPLARNFSEKSFLEIMKRSRGRIKSFLMNQRRIAGLGNLCVDEILFQAKIHPDKRIENMSLKDRKALYKTLRRVLKKMVDSFANESRMRSLFINHREEGAPCPRCKKKIRRIVLDGRGTYFCPNCQRQPYPPA